MANGPASLRKLFVSHKNVAFLIREINERLHSSTSDISPKISISHNTLRDMDRYFRTNGERLVMLHGNNALHELNNGYIASFEPVFSNLKQQKRFEAIKNDLNRFGRAEQADLWAVGGARRIGTKSPMHRPALDCGLRDLRVDTSGYFLQHPASTIIQPLL